MGSIRLYHFTSVAKLPDIIRTGRLALCESNLSPKRRMAGPPVVWLTRSDDPSRCGLEHDDTLKQLKDYELIDKTRIRFTVEVPKREAVRYPEWARSHGIDRRWLAHVMASGGAGSWYVAPKPVEMPDWVEVFDLQLNKAVWEAPPLQLDKGKGLMRI